MAQKKQFAKSQDVKIPSIDFIIGCYVTWMEFDRMEIQSMSETITTIPGEGTIVAISERYITVQDSNKATRDINKGEFADWLYDDYLKQLIGRNYFALKRRNDLAARENDTTDYDIYRLIDPLDKSIRYVGMSTDIELRFQQHITCQGNNMSKNSWIQGLHRQGLLPILEIIENVKGRLNALEQEQYWIYFYTEQGAPLTNKDRVAL